MVERKLDNIQDLGRHAGVSNADSARAEVLIEMTTYPLQVHRCQY